MHKIISALVFIILISCSDNILEDEIALIQEDIVYLSAERVVLTGRIVAKGTVNASDHGFLISANEQLSDSVIIALGPQNIPGRFVGNLDELAVNNRYWVAAYADLNGTRLLSETTSFSTLSPSLKEFSPLLGARSETITISGANFTNGTKVFFGDQEAQILDITGESIIRASIPQSQKEQFSTISLVSQGVSQSFDVKFEYVTGKWELVSEFPVNEFMYRENFWTEGEDFAVFGLGDFLFTMTYNDLIFLYDKKNDEWSTLSYEGGPLMEAFAAWPYFGSGAASASASAGTFKDFYRIEGKEIVKAKSLPIALYKSIAFSFDNSLFVFGGLDSSGTDNRKILEYNQDQDEWTILESRQFSANSDYPTFKYKNEGYYIGKDNMVMKFDPIDKTWTTVTQFPTNINIENTAQVVGSKVYVGVSKNRKDIWELDLESLLWKRKEPFTGNFRSTITANWQYDNKLFALRHNVFSGREPMEIWKFTPDGFQ